MKIMEIILHLCLSISLGSVDGLNVRIKDQKQLLIEKLEEELKRLKGE